MPDYYFKKYPAKKIHFIRHGEAEHNKIPNFSLPDPKYYFPHAFYKENRLTERGINQVSERKHDVDSLHVDLVVTSPLTRALQSTTGLFSGRKVPIIVNSDTSEFRKQTPDFGRFTTELSREFPHINFNHLPSVWWRSLESEEPITALKVIMYCLSPNYYS